MLRDPLTDSERRVERRLLLRIRSCERQHPGMDLLEDARDAEEDLRPHFRQVLRDMPWLWTARDRVPGGEALVVRGHALGDVGHRQVRHQPAPERIARSASARIRLSTVHTMLAWSSITPLGGPVVPEV